MQQMLVVTSFILNPVIFLTLFGLFFEFLPFVINIRKYGNPFSKTEEKKQKRYDRMTLTSGQKAEEEVWNFYRDFFWVFIGLALQGIAVIISEII